MTEFPTDDELGARLLDLRDRIEPIGADLEVPIAARPAPQPRMLRAAAAMFSAKRMRIAASSYGGSAKSKSRQTCSAERTSNATTQRRSRAVIFDSGVAIGRGAAGA